MPARNKTFPFTTTTTTNISTDKESHVSQRVPEFEFSIQSVIPEKSVRFPIPTWVRLVRPYRIHWGGFLNLWIASCIGNEQLNWIFPTSEEPSLCLSFWLSRVTGDPNKMNKLAAFSSVMYYSIYIRCIRWIYVSEQRAPMSSKGGQRDYYILNLGVAIHFIGVFII